MPSRHLETTAATLLTSWTDSDTAMQIVGVSLGLFGPGLLDPNEVLGRETPLRNALFDVLLSLVEGGALDLRQMDDAGYAFRFRTDFATAAFRPDTASAVDIDTPSPYLAELIQARRERDDALGRADFAEALAAERERQLRVAETPRAKPVRRPRVQAPPAPAPPETPPDVDLVTIEAEEHAQAEVPEPVAVAAPRLYASPEPPVTAPDVSVAAPEPEIEVAAVAVAEPALAADVIAGLPPEPVLGPVTEAEAAVAADAPPAPDVASEPDATPAEAKPAPAKKSVAKKAPAKKAATPKKRAAKKPVVKKPAVTEPAAEPVAEPLVAEAAHPAPAIPSMPAIEIPAIEIPEIETDVQPANEVVYLTPPVPADETDDVTDDERDDTDEASARRAKWSGYTLDKPRGHLASVERIADEG